MKSSVVNLSLNGNSFSCLLTCMAYQWSRVSCAFGPREVAFLFVFLHSAESRQRSTGFVFAIAHGGRHLFSASREMKTCLSNDNLNISSSCLGKSIKSPEERIFSSFEVGSQRILKYLTPSSALRDSRSRKWCISLHLRQACSSMLDLVFLLQAL